MRSTVPSGAKSISTPLTPGLPGNAAVGPRLNGRGARGRRRARQSPALSRCGFAGPRGLFQERLGKREGRLCGRGRLWGLQLRHRTGRSGVRAPGCNSLARIEEGRRGNLTARVGGARRRRHIRGGETQRALPLRVTPRGPQISRPAPDPVNRKPQLRGTPEITQIIDQKAGPGLSPDASISTAASSRGSNGTSPQAAITASGRSGMRGRECRRGG